MNASLPNLRQPSPPPMARPCALCPSAWTTWGSIRASRCCGAAAGPHLCCHQRHDADGPLARSRPGLGAGARPAGRGIASTLTESSPGRPGMPLGGLIRRSVLRQLDVAQLASSLRKPVGGFRLSLGQLARPRRQASACASVSPGEAGDVASAGPLARSPSWLVSLAGASVPALPAGLKGQVLAARWADGRWPGSATRGLPCSAGLTGIYGFDGPEGLLGTMAALAGP